MRKEKPRKPIVAHAQRKKEKGSPERLWQDDL